MARKKEDIELEKKMIEEKKKEKISLSPSARPTGADVGKTYLYPGGIQEVPGRIEHDPQIRALIGEKRRKEGIQTEVQMAEIQREAKKELPLTPEESVNLFKQAERNPEIMGEIEEKGVGSVAAPIVLKAMGKKVVDYAENIRAITTLGGRDTADVKEARDTFSKSNTAIGDDIKLVGAGVQNYDDVVKKIRDAEIQLQVMEREVHGKGLGNLRYWLLGGKDVEVEIELNREVLQEKLRQLNLMRLVK